ncbi:MAG: DUF2802 domain-containing protein [Halorhodospira sp.]
MGGLIGVALALVLVALAVAAYALRQAWQLLDRLRRLEQRVGELEASSRQILEHFRGLSAGAVGQGEHLARLEQNLARVRRRLDQVAAAGGPGSDRFHQAIRMARKGTTAGEIAETCEISQVEADLVVLLHGPGGKREGGGGEG